MSFKKNNLSNYAVYIFVYVIILAGGNSLEAQSIEFNNSVRDFENSRREINRDGMLVLGGWAVANIIAGSIGNFSSIGESKYFWQFNALWNSVNLGIAVFGYLGNQPLSAESQISLTESLKDYSSLQNLLLLNAGLDLVYITTGLLLREKSKNSDKNNLRLKGYGNSLLVQGGFLLLFDTALSLINLNNANLHLYPLIGDQEITRYGIGLILRI